MEQFTLFLISLLANLFSAFSGGGAGLVELAGIDFSGVAVRCGVGDSQGRFGRFGGGRRRYATCMKVGLEWWFSLFLLLSGIPGVILGASLILRVPDRVAEVALGILTLGLGVYSLLKRSLGQEYCPAHRDLPGYLLGGLGLFCIGFLNGSLTSGTGLFVTLWLVRWFGMDYRTAVAHTLVLVGMFWNGSGALTLSLLGEIQWEWLPVLLAGSLLGVYLGAHLSITKANRWIKRAFEVFTLPVGTKLVIG